MKKHLLEKVFNIKYTFRLVFKKILFDTLYFL